MNQQVAQSSSTELMDDDGDRDLSAIFDACRTLRLLELRTRPGMGYDELLTLTHRANAELAAVLHRVRALEKLIPGK